MDISRRLWLNPCEYEDLAERLEAERNEASATDDRILAAWGLQADTAREDEQIFPAVVAGALKQGATMDSAKQVVGAGTVTLTAGSMGEALQRVERLGCVVSAARRIDGDKFACDVLMTQASANAVALATLADNVEGFAPLWFLSTQDAADRQATAYH